MSELVKRVARAMVVANGFDPDERVHGVMTRVEAYLPTARAAIGAMREPTEAMLRVGTNSDEAATLLPDDWWRAMVDEALREAPHA